MKILIATVGTRGDVQPYIALGRALMASGHDTTICTCAHFEPFVRENGLGYGFSRHIIPRPHDWPKSTVVTGPWFLNQADDWKPPKILADFLSNGEPPVYFGFGSIFGRDPKRVTQIVREAVRRTGVRAILARGWGGLEPSDSGDSNAVLFIEAAPHDWLFPQVSAVVHHGGCGTTAAALLAGKPNIICPFFGDQPFWGRHVERLGVGPTPIPQRRLTVASLCRAIETVTHDLTMRETAAALGRRMRRENGTANAVDFITQWMHDN